METMSVTDLVLDGPLGRTESRAPGLLARRFERHRLCGKDAAFGIRHLDEHLVLAARHADQDDRVG